MPCDGFDVVHQAYLGTREAATIGARRERHEVPMCCGWRVEYPPQPRARRVGGMRSALPPRSEIRTPISAAANGVIAGSSMRLLVETRRGPQNKLPAAKRPSEDFSGVMIRMAKVEAMGSSRPPVAIAFRA
jgi:hypothetical protein